MEDLAGGPLMSPNGVLQASGVFSPGVIDDIQTKAESGLYRIRGYGTLRERRWATFDDLTFLPCSLTRIPLEGYRQKCSTKTVLGTRYARKPIELDIPIMITGMSWGALSYNAKAALAKGAASAGSSNTTGDGGMLMAERENSRTLVYEVLPSRYGIDIHHMRMADAIELTIGQGAKPGTGGLLLGSKVSDTIAKQRDLPIGVDQRSPARHPDFLGPDDMIIKVEELRQLHIVIDPAGAHLDKDRDLPVGCFASFFDLDLHVARAQNILTTRWTALIDPNRQISLLRDSVRNFRSQEQSTGAWLSALADGQLDGVRYPHVVNIDPVTRRQNFIDQRLAVLALRLQHSAIAGSVGRSH